jgi:hypothetical protein
MIRDKILPVASAALLTMLLGMRPAAANILTSATITPDCTGYTVGVGATDLNAGTTYFVTDNITLSCGGSLSSFSGTPIAIAATGSTGNGTATGSWPSSLSGQCSASVKATLTSSGSQATSATSTFTCPTSCNGAIGNFVWNDANDNGIQDAGEAGIGGVMLHLTDGSGHLIATTTTTSTGYYQFTGLCAGTYGLTVDTPPGYTPSPCRQGSDRTKDSNCLPESMTLTNSTVDEAFDFGYYKPLCSTNGSIAANFNGTAINGGDYIWFNANFTAKGIPSSGAVVTFKGSTIAMNGQILVVPSARITFSSAYSCVATNYDALNNTFNTTAPLGGSDEIFLTGLAYPVPSGFGGSNTAPVWTGTFGSNVPGVSMSWKWGAAVYTTFSTNYSALNPLAGHGNACVGNSGGDHAGTPEGIASTGLLFKKYVVGGARGGGGSNWTGSWSGTQSVTPVCH